MNKIKTTLEKPIGILGGTFDPIHNGHLRMGLELFEALDLKAVHFIPCFLPVHRKVPIANANHRLNMVECATKDERFFVPDGREIERGKPSYTIETVLEMRETFPTTPLCIMMGLDAFLGFTSWYRYDEILNHAHLVIAFRPQYQFPKVGPLAEIVKVHFKDDIDFIHENIAGGILFRPITALEISASEIRKHFATQKNPRYLLPDAVYDYIKQYNIYQTSSI